MRKHFVALNTGWRWFADEEERDDERADCSEKQPTVTNEHPTDISSQSVHCSASPVALV